MTTTASVLACVAGVQPERHVFQNECASLFSSKLLPFGGGVQVEGLVVRWSVLSATSEECTVPRYLSWNGGGRGLR